MRQVLEMALEALEKIATVNAMDYEYQQWAKEYLAAIKEALAQPEQEPVAWLCKRKDGHFDVLSDQTCTKCFPVYTHPESEQNDKFCDANCVWTDHHPDCKLAQPEKQSVTWNDKIGGIGFKEPMPNANYKVTATVAPQRKPLTDEQIIEMYNEPRSDAEMLEFARAIEAAHGIKGDA